MGKLNFNNTKFICSYGKPEQLPPSTLPEIVFCGRSNCGKSSLLNKICNRKGLAKVSSTPGKTTLINFFEAGDAYLVDLPGYGFAARDNKEISRWTNLIEQYLESERNIAILVLLLDIRHKPSKQDVMMLDYINNLGLPVCIALTKADKLSKQKCASMRKQISSALQIEGHVPTFIVSALKNSGISELKSQLNLVV